MTTMAYGYPGPTGSWRAWEDDQVVAGSICGLPIAAERTQAGPMVGAGSSLRVLSVVPGLDAPPHSTVILASSMMRSYL